MKLHKIFLCVLVSIIFIYPSCKLDNYPAPKAGIQGAIIDSSTGKQVQTEQPNGIDMRLIETKYGDNVTPTDFWCKPDGSFENTQIFSGQYKIVPIQGAFFPADTATVNVSGITTVNFKVTPFLTITATVTPTTGGVTTGYTISREKVGDKIITAKTLVSAFPSVSNAINEFNASHDLSGTADDTILGSQYTDTITGLTSGSTYYVRIAASTANAYNKYNYSEIFKVVIP